MCVAQCPLCWLTLGHLDLTAGRDEEATEHCGLFCVAAQPRCRDWEHAHALLHHLSRLSTHAPARDQYGWCRVLLKIPQVCSQAWSTINTQQRRLGCCQYRRAIAATDPAMSHPLLQHCTVHGSCIPHPDMVGAPGQHMSGGAPLAGLLWSADQPPSAQQRTCPAPAGAWQAAPCMRLLTVGLILTTPSCRGHCTCCHHGCTGRNGRTGRTQVDRSILTRGSKLTYMCRRWALMQELQHML